MSTDTYRVYILVAGQTERSTSASPVTFELGLSSIAAAAALNSSRKYRVHLLVHVEAFASPQEAIAREKQQRNRHRDWKIQLIEKDNSSWSDLSHFL